MKIRLPIALYLGVLLMPLLHAQTDPVPPDAEGIFVPETSATALLFGLALFGLHALQRKVFNAKASNSTPARNRSIYETSLINGCLGFPAMQTSRIALRRLDRR